MFYLFGFFPPYFSCFLCGFVSRHLYFGECESFSEKCQFFCEKFFFAFSSSSGPIHCNMLTCCALKDQTNSAMDSNFIQGV